jgi:hypothetical protein
MATVRKPAAVSMDPVLFERAKARSVALGFPTFSAYVSQLIRADIIGGGDLNVQEEPKPPEPASEARYEVQYAKPKRTARP